MVMNSYKWKNEINKHAKIEKMKSNVKSKKWTVSLPKKSYNKNQDKVRMKIRLKCFWLYMLWKMNERSTDEMNH